MNHRMPTLLLSLIVVAVAVAKPPRDIPELVEDAGDSLAAAEAYLPDGGPAFEALIDSAVDDAECALRFDYFCCMTPQVIPCMGSTPEAILGHMQWCADMALNSYPNNAPFEKNCLHTIVVLEGPLLNSVENQR